MFHDSDSGYWGWDLLFVFHRLFFVTSYSGATRAGLDTLEALLISLAIWRLLPSAYMFVPGRSRFLFTILDLFYLEWVSDIKGYLINRVDPIEPKRIMDRENVIHDKYKWAITEQYRKNLEWEKHNMQDPKRLQPKPVFQPINNECSARKSPTIPYQDHSMQFLGYFRIESDQLKLIRVHSSEFVRCVSWQA